MTPVSHPTFPTSLQVCDRRTSSRRRKLKELNLDETPQSLEAVTKVCDVAGKEYAIEQVT